MTSADKVRQCLTSAEMVHANLMTFAQDTNEPNVKKMYYDLAKEMEGVITKLRGRLGHMEDEEPQYRQS